MEKRTSKSPCKICHGRGTYEVWVPRRGWSRNANGELISEMIQEKTGNVWTCPCSRKKMPKIHTSTSYGGERGLHRKRFNRAKNKQARRSRRINRIRAGR